MSTLKLLEEMSLKEIIVRKENREFNIHVLKGFLPIRTTYFKCNS